MIVACTSCSAQYSVPDARIRGKKVRITCKHCGGGIVVDATDEPEREEVRLAELEALSSSDLHDEPTRVASLQTDWSVHDEPTVIGRIPAAALEAERRFAQSTIPPPEGEEDESEAVRALPHDVPEAPLDVTDIASPQAKRQSQGSLHPEPLIAPRARPVRSLPPQPHADVKTLLSRVDPELDSGLPPVARKLHALLAALAVLALVLALMQMTR